MAHAKQVQVRQRYQAQCGYCGVAEVDTGSELTVDHYQPRAAGGGDEDDNLVYACIKCNQYKGDFTPNDEDIRDRRRVLHPLHDERTSHLQVNSQTGYIEPLTATGRFHLTLLQLNRPALVAYRLRHRLHAALREKNRFLEAENQHLRATVAAQQRYIAHLRQLLGFPPA